MANYTFAKTAVLTGRKNWDTFFTEDSLTIGPGGTPLGHSALGS
jgi:hypothetical protein